MRETRGPHFIQEEEAHQWLVKLRLIPPHINYSWLLPLPLPLPRVSCCCKVLKQGGLLCKRELLPLFHSFVRSFPFPEFFPAAICLKWSTLSLPPSLSRFYQEPPGRVRQEAENYRSPTELSLRRENSGGFSEGLYCPSLLSPSPSSERRNKIYATSLQLDRLPLKYLPSSHKFEHNRSTVRPAPKAQYFVHKKLTILSG